jgi:hypothetical protein
MRIRCVRSGSVTACCLTVLLVMVVAVLPAAAAPLAPSDPTRELWQDADGDGMEDFLDPDDDGDGVADNEDPAPLDPNISANPTPGPIDVDQDNDNDGIPGYNDPDDDQDGIADEEDPAPFDPTPVTETPVATQPAPAPEPAYEPEVALPAAPEVVEQPLVFALPVTGHGPSSTGTEVLSAVAIGLATLLLGIVGCRLHRSGDPA